MRLCVFSALCSRLSTLNKSEVKILNKSFCADEFYNVPDSILKKCNDLSKIVNKHNHHPIFYVAEFTKNFFVKQNFDYFDNFHPVVSVEQNFDNLLVPEDHPGRSASDNYYINKNQLLRSHMTVHDIELLQRNKTRFITFGDVYRKDEIDTTHYPVFHQVDGLCLVENLSDEETLQHFKSLIESYLIDLFVENGNSKKEQIRFKWSGDSFPFTHPSIQLDMSNDGGRTFYEILGAGIIKDEILTKNGKFTKNQKAWAFGMGLERICMLKFEIPDIRYLWSQDPRLSMQFRKNKLFTRFVKFTGKYEENSKFVRDVAFFLGDEKFDPLTDKNLVDRIRDMSMDNLEELKLIDSFTCPKTNKTSHCYRFTYKVISSNLSDLNTKNQINTIHASIVDYIKSMNVLIR